MANRVPFRAQRSVHVRRCRQLVRTLEVLRALEGRPRTVGELAAGVGEGVTIRTIYRDLDALQAAGFPLFSERDEDDIVRWQLVRKGIATATGIAA